MDGKEGAVWGTKGDVMDQTAALEEGMLAVDAAGVILAALAYVDDATLCCVPKSRFDPGELPFEVFYCRHPGSMLCNVSVCGWPSRSPESSPLHSRLTKNPQRLASRSRGWYSTNPWQVS